MYHYSMRPQGALVKREMATIALLVIALLAVLGLEQRYTLSSHTAQFATAGKPDVEPCPSGGEYDVDKSGDAKRAKERVNCVAKDAQGKLVNGKHPMCSGGKDKKGFSIVNYKDALGNPKKTVCSPGQTPDAASKTDSANAERLKKTYGTEYEKNLPTLLDKSTEAVRSLENQQVSCNSGVGIDCADVETQINQVRIGQQTLRSVQDANAAIQALSEYDKSFDKYTTGEPMMYASQYDPSKGIFSGTPAARDIVSLTPEMQTPTNISDVDVPAHPLAQDPTFEARPVNMVHTQTDERGVPIGANPTFDTQRERLLDSIRDANATDRLRIDEADERKAALEATVDDKYAWYNPQRIFGLAPEQLEQRAVWDKEIADAQNAIATRTAVADYLEKGARSEEH